MKITNSLNLPQPFVDAASNEHKYKDKQYSATSLLKGIREVILERRHSDEITVDVADMVWLIFGTAVHKILQDAQETNTQIKEGYLTEDVCNGYTLSGIFDLYDGSNETVTDYKTASVWKQIIGDWRDYRKQLLIYAWLLEKNGFSCKHGQIVALFKDHKIGEAKRKADYPNHPVFVVRFDFKPSDFAAVERFIESRFSELERAESLPDDELPLCSPEERYHQDDKWAVKKPGNKKAYRVFDNEQDAIAVANNLGYEIEFRPGEDTRCLDYCNARHFCSHYKELING